MDDKDPTSVIKILNDFKSASSSFHRNSGISVRLSGAGMAPIQNMENIEQCQTPQKRKRLDDSVNLSMNKSTSDSVPGSPWEWTRMKGELVSLRTKLSHSEANVKQLHKIRREMEQVFEKEKSMLEIQAELDKQTIKQLELRVDAARRSAQEATEAQAVAEKELSLTRSQLEQKVLSLMNENARLVESHRHANATESAIFVAPKEEKDVTELQMRFEAAEQRIAELEEKLKESRAAQQDAEVKSVELQNARIKIENLESERALWEEGKLLSARAARASDLEKELNSSRETLNQMRESIKGKLLLEEEMFNMRQRIEHMEKLEEKVATLESKRDELLRKLVEYESLGFGGDATALRRELNRLQQCETVLTAEEGQLRSKIGSLQRENQTLLKKYEEAKKIATEMTTSTERLNKLVGRLQKKMILVTRERDSYRQQLDLYEKEMTTVESNNAMVERIPALERALEGYRDLVSKLEADLGDIENGQAKDECQRLREEIDRLKGELEHRALKGDFNCNARVLHFSMNPAAIAGQQAEEKQQALLREVEELRARVEMGGGSSVVGVSSLHAQEIAELKKTNEIKIDRLKEAFRVSSQEYRQACYQLFGWRVDRTKEGEYKLFSQYAEAPDDFLFFQIGEDGVHLIETDFSSTLGTHIERHLQRQHSVPMFINAVQADLFAQQTMTNIMDTC